MKVRFKNGNGICYEVLDKEQVVMPDEISGTCMPNIKLETLGYVPCFLLEPEKEGDIDTLEVLIKLTLEGKI